MLMTLVGEDDVNGVTVVELVDLEAPVEHRDVPF
jgi:hypothetical protein